VGLLGIVLTVTRIAPGIRQRSESRTDPHRAQCFLGQILYEVPETLKKPVNFIGGLTNNPDKVPPEDMENAQI